MNERLRQSLREGEQVGMRYTLGLPPRAPTGLSGGALSQRVGSSLEFKDYRDYQPGDDLRHIDWNAYARSDQLTVKLFREEVTPHVDIVLDASRSMALEGSTKAEATLALAALFAAAAGNAGYSHAAWQMGGDYRPVGNGKGMASSWEGIAFAHCGEPGEVRGLVPPMWRPRGIRVLLSDLLWLGDPLLTLRHFTERASLTVVVQVLAESDVEPHEGGNLRLIDAETEEMREIYVDAMAVRQYKDALARHQQNWHRACRQTGALLTTLVAERWLRDWNLDELVAAEVLRVV